MNGRICLIIYVIVWAYTFYKYQKYKKTIDAGSLLIGSFVFYSISSWILSYDSYWGSNFEDITLFPFIYLYLMLMLAFFPVLRYDPQSIKKVQMPNKTLMNGFIFIFVVCSMTKLINIIPNFVSGVTKILIDSAAGLDMYHDALIENENIGNGTITNLPSIIANAMGDVGILMAFYYLTLPKPKKLVAIGLLLSCVVTILESIASAQRGPAIERLLVMLITFFALRTFYPDKVQKVARRVGIVAIILISLPMVAVTISRFEREEGGAGASTFYYLGQQNLYFNSYALDDGGIRYGDRTFPVFKRMLGFDNVPQNYAQRRAKYPNLKINDEVFSSFVGDFVIDFGPIIAVIIFLIFFLYSKEHTKPQSGILPFHRLLLLHFIMCICMQGGLKLYPYSDLGGNLKLIMFIMCYIAFKVSNNISNKTVYGRTY